MDVRYDVYPPTPPPSPYGYPYAVAGISNEPAASGFGCMPDEDPPVYYSLLPDTGAPILLIPVAGGALVAGGYLLRRRLK